MLSDQLELKHALVREVLAYYSDRGAILIDVEVSAGAEQLYMFSHRLFQEYLAVEYLVGRLEPQDDVVAELAAFSRRSRSLSVWGLGLKAWAERRGVPADLVGRLRKVVKVGDEEEQTGGAVTGLIEAMRDEPDRRPVDDLLGWLRQMPANSYRAEMETVRAWRNGRRPGQA